LVFVIAHAGGIHLVLVVAFLYSSKVIAQIVPHRGQAQVIPAFVLPVLVTGPIPHLGHLGSMMVSFQ
jgi:hypothetical protein